ncbi:MAG: amidase domain-containing protein [Bacillota bacterium]
MAAFKKTRQILIALPVVALLVLSILSGIYLRDLFDRSIDKNSNNTLSVELQQLFDLKNKALLKEDADALRSLYNIQDQNGLQAYEYEHTKMKNLRKWSNKQSVSFNQINSEVVIQNSNKTGNGYSLDLLVSTEYQYTYENAPLTHDSFRIGTYHTLDIISHEERWLIIRENYADPFGKSIDFNDFNIQEIQQIILSEKDRDLSPLSERRIKAIDYADRYCGSASLPQYSFQYNPKYKNYTDKGGDCTNFASQVMYEGGNFSQDSTWNYDYNDGQASKSWANAASFNEYMLNSGRASVIAYGPYHEVVKDSYKLLPGDYVAFEEEGEVAHISIVTGADSKGYALVNSHTSDRYRAPWDIGWNVKGVKYWLVSVHY